MDDLKDQMKDHFIQYASYVILDRAIPNVIDGLKPVQSRILETLWRLNDEKLHKVANVVGQTMQLHPHGDAPIYEALVNLANKGFMLDRQGNFGNIFTGDPSAASRYIETRLSPLARETLFNPDITEKSLPMMAAIWSLSPSLQRSLFFSCKAPMVSPSECQPIFCRIILQSFWKLRSPISKEEISGFILTFLPAASWTKRV